MTNKEGDGDFVTVGEFRRQGVTTNVALEKVIVALWGMDGRGGIVGDIRDIKTKSKITDRVITLIVGISASVVTALILRMI